MAKLRITEFEVVGTGTFPVDMLRYDACYPIANAESILTPRRELFSEEEWNTPRRVRLHHRDVYAGFSPTYDRWASFGWHVDRNTERSWTS